ncbi:uncharacterized protein LOC131151451 [Malania oleifera]|uniref:uncharacterized protein LOC131151451 n=1 Tax=Malania oleifera TaxID=397392 RepID=UPI0025AEA5D2|nr:uncharacterized protein LOC131151451 [Malania oleifera]
MAGENWIQEIEEIMVVLDYKDEQKVRYAAFKMTGEAKCSHKKRGRARSQPKRKIRKKPSFSFFFFHAESRPRAFLSASLSLRLFLSFSAHLPNSLYSSSLPCLRPSQPTVAQLRGAIAYPKLSCNPASQPSSALVVTLLISAAAPITTACSSTSSPVHAIAAFPLLLPAATTEPSHHPGETPVAAISPSASASHCQAHPIIPASQLWPPLTIAEHPTDQPIFDDTLSQWRSLALTHTETTTVAVAPFPLSSTVSANTINNTEVVTSSFRPLQLLRRHPILSPFLFSLLLSPFTPPFFPNFPSCSLFRSSCNTDQSDVSSCPAPTIFRSGIPAIRPQLRPATTLLQSPSLVPAITQLRPTGPRIDDLKLPRHSWLSWRSSPQIYRSRSSRKRSWISSQILGCRVRNLAGIQPDFYRGFSKLR